MRDAREFVASLCSLHSFASDPVHRLMWRRVLLSTQTGRFATRAHALAFRTPISIAVTSRQLAATSDLFSHSSRLICSSIRSMSSLAAAPPMSPAQAAADSLRSPASSPADAARVSAAAAALSAPLPPLSASSRADQMNIVSWNVNGLRSPSMKSNPLPALFAQYAADIFCVQETKLSGWEGVTNDIALVPGYDAFFSFSRARKGWSGTATYVREGCTLAAREDLGDADLDGEGRIVCTDHGRFVLFNVYFPNGGTGPERQAHKMRFYAAFERQVRALRAQGRRIIVVGDVNTAHRSIDIAEPERFVNSSGVLPEERAWMDGMVRTDVTYAQLREASGTNDATDQYDASFMQSAAASSAAALLPAGESAETAVAASSSAAASAASSLIAESSQPFIDSYRFFHPFQKAGCYTFWDMRTQKREVNLGWRIDYMLVDVGLVDVLADAQVHQKQRGSDHCPTSLHLRLPCLPTTDAADQSSALAPAVAAEARAARIASFLDIHSFPHPAPPLAARNRREFKSALQPQESVLSFFGKKPSSAKGKTVPASATAAVPSAVAAAATLAPPPAQPVPSVSSAPPAAKKRSAAAVKSSPAKRTASAVDAQQPTLAAMMQPRKTVPAEETQTGGAASPPIKKSRTE